jgi:hypothetical protein
MLLRMGEEGRREVVLQRCDTESITLEEITGGESEDGEERKHDTCPINKTVRINDTRTRTQGPKHRKINSFQAVEKSNAERRPA